MTPNKWGELGQPELPRPVGLIQQIRFGSWRRFVGTYLLVGLSLKVKTADLVPLLPKKLSLRPARTAPYRYVTLLFTSLQNGRFPGVPFIRDISLTYQETILMVPSAELKPGVASRGYRGAFNYGLRLDLNHWIPTVLGRLMGYPKKLSTIGSGPRWYNVKRRSRREPIMSLMVEVRGQEGGVNDFPDFKKKFLPSFVRPVVSQIPVIKRLAFSSAKWHLEQARVHPVKAELDCAFGPSSPLSFIDGHHSCPSVDEDGLGAFLMQVSFELIAPVYRSDLKRVRESIAGWRGGLHRAQRAARS